MNVLLVLGHPRTESFCGALAQAYRDGALEAGADVRKLALADLEFDPDVHTECPSEQELEADLLEARRGIEWADHLVFVYPNWWGTMPALLKGFFDRLFTPGFAFEHYEDGAGAGKRELLSEKTAELIVTMTGSIPTARHPSNRLICPTAFAINVSAGAENARGTCD